MHVQHNNHGRRLWKFEAEFATDADLHEISGQHCNNPNPVGFIRDLSALKSIKSNRR